MPKELTVEQRRIEEARQKLAKASQARLDGTAFVLNPPPVLSGTVPRARISAKDIPVDGTFHNAELEAARIEVRKAEALERVALQREARRAADEAIAERQRVKDEQLTELKRKARAGEELTVTEQMQLDARHTQRAAWARANNLL